MRVYMQLQAARRWNKQEWRPRAKSGGSTGVCVSVQVLGGGDGKLQSRSCVGFGTTEAGGCRVRAPDGHGRLRLGSQAASCWQGHGVQRGSAVRHGNGAPWSWLLTRAYVVHMYRCRGDARKCVSTTTGNQVAAQRLGKHGCGARATNVWSWVVERTKLGLDRSRASKANTPSFVAE